MNVLNVVSKGLKILTVKTVTRTLFIVLGLLLIIQIINSCIVVFNDSNYDQTVPKGWPIVHM